MLKASFNKLIFIFKEEGIPNLCSRLFRYLAYRIKRLLKRSNSDLISWTILKNNMEINRVFLIGNGPSLNKTPIHLLKNEITFCMNRFNLMFDRIPWRPDMYGISDDVVILDMLNEIDTIKKEINYLFLPDIHPSSPININYKNIIKDHEKIYWFHPDKLEFSNDLPSLGLNKTITNVAIQILVFLGFKEIYLVGIDSSYVSHKSAISPDGRHLESTNDDDPNHFDGRYFGTGRNYHIPRMEETFRKYEEAKEFCSNHDVKVFNATVGGKLEIFPRVEFNSLFNISAEEELNLLLSVIGRDSGGFDDLHKAVPEAIKIMNLDNYDINSKLGVAQKSLGQKLIGKLLPTHIPLGPYKGKYLFYKRDS